jgi:hypothetical protein
MPAVDVDGTASAVDADETSPNTNGQRLVIAE